MSSPASAATSPFGAPIDIASGLVSPLSLDVDGTGVSYIAQNFAGTIERVTAAGARSTLVAAPGQELGGVSVRGGTVYYTQSAFDLSETSLWSVPSAGGAPTRLADIRAFEARTNPDASVSYGFTGITDECAAQLPPGFPTEYTGLVDSHPYATAADGRGVFVADAAANAVFRVGYDGRVSTVAVLPAQPPVRVSAEVAAANGLPACVAEFPFVAESVPTDVEIGPGGTLYVSTLPGGPEDPSLGARGSVYTVSTSTGRVRLHSTGFGSATGLAVTPVTGVVFVAELFGGPRASGQVSVVLPGSSRPTASVPVATPAAVELRGGKLYVTRSALGPEGAPPAGRVTTVPLLPTLR